MSRLEAQQISAARLKVVEAGRTSVCAGCHFVVWYPPDATVDQVVGDLKRWAADPTQYPPRSDRGWCWDVGEELAIWHAGKVLAIVTRTAAGVNVRRCDGGAEVAAV